MSQKTPVTVACGDGIGPEVMEVSLDIIQETGAGLALDSKQMTSNRGTIIWPTGMPETFVTNNYHCRFQRLDGDSAAPVTKDKIVALFQKVIRAGYDMVKMETLRTFDGKPGFSLTQGR